MGKKEINGSCELWITTLNSSCIFRAGASAYLKGAGEVHGTVFINICIGNPAESFHYFAVQTCRLILPLTFPSLELA